VDAPRLRFADHLRVFGLLLLTLLGIVPVVVWCLFSPVLRPLVRARMRRRLRRGAASPAPAPAVEASTWEGRTLFVVAGEASGDRLLAPVVRALRTSCPGLHVRGYAGPAAAEAGVALDRDVTEHAVMGVIAVINSLGYWWGLCAETLARLRDDPPDVFLTVDFPGLNARLARWARVRGVPTVHLVAPAVWAYAPWRILRWRRAIDHLLTIFPHEAALFRGSGLPATFVGHPLFEAPLPPPRTPETWPGDGACQVDLLPGSRRHELTLQAALVLEAGAEIERRVPGAQFVVRLADERHRALFEAGARRAGARPGRWDVRIGAGTALEDPPLLGAVASSGTVTAELGAALVPMAIFYRVSPGARVASWVGLTAPWIGLVNLIAGDEVAPERLLTFGGGRRIAEDFLRVAGTEAAWRATRERLGEVRQRIALPDVAARAARSLLAAAAPRLSAAE
jgi:lipid-A-disaccharide synthase